MESETEKYHRRRNRDQRFGRWLAFILVSPFLLALATCAAIAIRAGGS